MQTDPPKTVDDCISWISGLVDSAAQTVCVLKQIGLRWTADKKDFADKAQAWDQERGVLQSELEKVKRQYLGLRRDHKRIRYNLTRTVRGLVYPRQHCSNCKNCKCVKPTSEVERTWHTLAVDIPRSPRATVGACLSSQAGRKTLSDETSDDRGEGFPGDQTKGSQQRRENEKQIGSSGTGERKERPIRAEMSPIPATPPRPGSKFRASKDSIGGTSGGNFRGHGHSSRIPVGDVEARNSSAQAPRNNQQWTSSFSASGRKRSRLELASSETKDALTHPSKGSCGRMRNSVIEMPETSRHSTREVMRKHLAGANGVNFAMNEAGRRQEIVRNIADGARVKSELCEDKTTDESKLSVGIAEAARVDETHQYLEQDIAADSDDAERDSAGPTVSKEKSRGAPGVPGRDGESSSETGGNPPGSACESAHYPELALTMVSPKRKPRRLFLEGGARPISCAPAGEIEPSRLAPAAAKDCGDLGEGEIDRVPGGSDPSNAPKKIMQGGELDGVDKKQSSRTYKFHEAVKDRAKRAAMKGHHCEHCQAYVEAVAATPGERQKLLNLCSRHRHDEKNGQQAETPDGFWELSFADSMIKRDFE